MPYLIRNTYILSSGLRAGVFFMPPTQPTHTPHGSMPHMHMHMRTRTHTVSRDNLHEDLAYWRHRAPLKANATLQLYEKLAQPQYTAIFKLVLIYKVTPRAYLVCQVAFSAGR